MEKGLTSIELTFILNSLVHVTFIVAVLTVYCIVQVPQVLLRSRSQAVQCLKRSASSKAYLLQIKLKETIVPLTVIRLTMLLMYV